MKILFLDHSGVLGGAELSLLDIARYYQDSCLVVLLAEGAFKTRLEQEGIPVQVLTSQLTRIKRDSSFWQSLSRLGQILPLIVKIAQLSRNYDVICTNTQKSMVLGAISSLISRRPLVYYLRDILSADHFNRANLWIAVTIANLCATKVIANSKATQAAFVAAGGKAELTQVIYNGFLPDRFQQPPENAIQLRQELGLEGQFVVGSFSRLSPWKGQHVLLEALTHCPQNVTVLLVGDALFGETAYVERLHQQVVELGLGDRVKFLGFRADVSSLMGVCDLVAHTSTAPEPFGRVIIEAMLCRTPIVATAAGGVLELIEPNRTGWLVPVNDAVNLAGVINECRIHPEQAAVIAQRAYQYASHAFHLDETCRKFSQWMELVKSFPNF